MQAASVISFSLFDVVVGSFSFGEQRTNPHFILFYFIFIHLFFNILKFSMFYSCMALL